MKVVYTIWTWSKNTDKGEVWAEGKWRIEEALREISFLGYDGIEHFKRLADLYDGCDDEFETLLKEYKLEFPAIYLHLTGDMDADCRNAEYCAAFAQRHGASYMIMQAPWREGRNIQDADIRLIASISDQIGAIAASHGLTLCFHPHWDTWIETSEQIDRYAALIDGTKVFFCLDTAHTTICGMDAKTEFKKYADRIRYVHLKDVDADAPADMIPPRTFVPLGQGKVDIKGVVNLLKSTGYDGYLCVELDYPRVCNFYAAAYSRQYLRDVVGV